MLLACQPTLRHYTHEDKSKRRVIGNAAGRKAILSEEDGQFVADVVRRADRGNDGKSKLKILDIIQDLNPSLTQKQARNAYTYVKSTLRRAWFDNQKARCDPRDFTISK